MPPERAPAASQRPATGTVPCSFLVQAAGLLDTSGLDPSPFRRTTRASSKSFRAQSMPSLNTPSLEPLLAQSVQLALTTTRSQTACPQPTPRKRTHESIEEGPVKRRRTESESSAWLPPSKDLLTRKNLEKLNSETASKTSDSMAEKKRTFSCLSSTSESKQGSASMPSTSSHNRSTFSHANYRSICLNRAGIVVQHQGIPEHLMHRVNSIIQPELDEDQERLVFSAADNLWNRFPEVLQSASREDDCVGMICHALGAMNRKLYGNAFGLPRKADWDAALQPKPRQLYSFDFSVLKRQQTEASHVSPEISDTTMPPPPRPSMLDKYYVKKPRPDITIGTLNDVVTQRLASLGVNKHAAKQMLTVLQLEGELLSSPTVADHHIRFPSLVVEGKSYATGRNMYEAENQVAVAGSSMLVMQDRLAEFTERCSPGTHGSLKEPLAFSVTQEGPIMLLWVHYITSDENVRFYNMHVLSICHATIQSTTREFFMALAGVMRWASTEFLDDVAAQLLLVWNATNSQTT
ncbi:hypothetical protein LTS15_010552 [Exophiala xenobiotica]|nr:hypothetical protein LTS15_010552 [Exophiala xenobiotica]